MHNLGVRPLPLRFFTHTQATRPIDSIWNVPAYNEVLKLERLDPGQQRQPLQWIRQANRCSTSVDISQRKWRGKPPQRITVV